MAEGGGKTGGQAPASGSVPGALDVELAELRARVQQIGGMLPARIDLQPDDVQRDLAKLVLTLIEFIRRLLERQAIRRMEGGTLTEAEVERMGLALMELEAALGRLKQQFGLGDEELNLHLGPLGDLM